MPKDLLNFLFNDSFKPTSDEAISDVFEKLSEIEDIETKKGPLAKALKAIGHAGEVCINDDGTAQICTDDSRVYSELNAALHLPDNLLQLAELGWVPTFKDNDSEVLDTPHFSIGFICISDPTPSDDDKIEDLENILKTMNEPNEDGPEGIGADDDKLPAGLSKKKDLTVPTPKNPKPDIHDSVDEKIKPGDRVKVGVAPTDLTSDHPAEGTEGKVVETYHGIAVVQFASGKQYGFAVEELVPIRD